MNSLTRVCGKLTSEGGTLWVNIGTHQRACLDAVALAPELGLHLTRVLVPPEAPDQGIGTALVEEVGPQAPRLGFKLLTVAPGGYSSRRRDQRRFYTQNGFTPSSLADGLLEHNLKKGPEDAKID